MDLVAGVRKEGSRGGRGDFKWSDVKESTHRENYLGHSVMAPVGRWQQGKDLHWYARGDEDPDEIAKREREERRQVKDAEEEAMARALGLPPPEKSVASNANTAPLGDRGFNEPPPSENLAEQDLVKDHDSRDRKRRRHERSRSPRKNRERHRAGDRDRHRTRDNSDRRHRDNRDEREEQNHDHHRKHRRHRHRSRSGSGDRGHHRRRSHSRSRSRNRRDGDDHGARRGHQRTFPSVDDSNYHRRR